MRTDLAKESRMEAEDIPGIAEETEYKGGLEITRIDVLTKAASEQLDKPIGRYVSIVSPAGAFMDRKARSFIARSLASELHQMAPNVQSALVIGLGNRYITADALGTRTAEYVLVTRHVHMHMRDLLPNGTPVVASFCANVLGVTGMETAEVVSALTQKIRPGLVILIDSLAASRTEHLGRFIQCNDSGLAPGAGVGNFRQTLSRVSLGVPVIALGVPLVVSAETILASNGCDCGADPGTKELIVTPKDIDAMVKDASRVLSDAVNLMLFGDNYPTLEKVLR